MMKLFYFLIKSIVFFIQNNFQQVLLQIISQQHIIYSLTQMLLQKSYNHSQDSSAQHHHCPLLQIIKIFVDPKPEVSKQMYMESIEKIQTVKIQQIDKGSLQYFISTYSQTLAKTSYAQQILQNIIVMLKDRFPYVKIDLLQLLYQELMFKNKTQKAIQKLVQAYQINLSLKTKLTKGFKYGIYACQLMRTKEFEQFANQIIVYLKAQIQKNVKPMMNTTSLAMNVYKCQIKVEKLTPKEKQQKMLQIYKARPSQHKKRSYSQIKKSDGFVSKNIQRQTFNPYSTNIKSPSSPNKHKLHLKNHKKSKSQILQLHFLLYEIYMLCSLKMSSDIKKKYFKDLKNQLKIKVIRQFSGMNVQQILFDIQLQTLNNFQKEKQARINKQKYQKTSPTQKLKAKILLKSQLKTIHIENGSQQEKNIDVDANGSYAKNNKNQESKQIQTQHKKSQNLRVRKIHSKSQHKSLSSSQIQTLQIQQKHQKFYPVQMTNNNKSKIIIKKFEKSVLNSSQQQQSLSSSVNNNNNHNNKNDSNKQNTSKIFTKSMKKKSNNSLINSSRLKKFSKVARPQTSSQANNPNDPPKQSIQIQQLQHQQHQHQHQQCEKEKNIEDEIQENCLYEQIQESGQQNENQNQSQNLNLNQNGIQQSIQSIQISNVDLNMSKKQLFLNSAAEVKDKTKPNNATHNTSHLAEQQQQPSSLQQAKNNLQSIPQQGQNHLQSKNLQIDVQMSLAQSQSQQQQQLSDYQQQQQQNSPTQQALPINQIHYFQIYNDTSSIDQFCLRLYEQVQIACENYQFSSEIKEQQQKSSINQIRRNIQVQVQVSGHPQQISQKRQQSRSSFLIQKNNKLLTVKQLKQHAQSQQQQEQLLQLQLNEQEQEQEQDSASKQVKVKIDNKHKQLEQQGQQQLECENMHVKLQRCDSQNIDIIIHSSNSNKAGSIQNIGKSREIDVDADADVEGEGKVCNNLNKSDNGNNAISKVINNFNNKNGIAVIESNFSQQKYKAIQSAQQFESKIRQKQMEKQMQVQMQMEMQDNVKEVIKQWLITDIYQKIIQQQATTGIVIVTSQQQQQQQQHKQSNHQQSQNVQQEKPQPIILRQPQLCEAELQKQRLQKEFHQYESLSTIKKDLTQRNIQQMEQTSHKPEENISINNHSQINSRASIQELNNFITKNAKSIKKAFMNNFQFQNQSDNNQNSAKKIQNCCGYGTTLKNNYPSTNFLGSNINLPTKKSIIKSDSKIRSKKVFKQGEGDNQQNNRSSKGQQKSVKIDSNVQFLSGYEHFSILKHPLKPKVSVSPYNVSLTIHHPSQRLSFKLQKTFDSAIIVTDYMKGLKSRILKALNCIIQETPTVNWHKIIEAVKQIDLQVKLIKLKQLKLEYKKSQMLTVSLMHYVQYGKVITQIKKNPLNIKPIQIALGLNESVQIIAQAFNSKNVKIAIMQQNNQMVAGLQVTNLWTNLQKIEISLKDSKSKLKCEFSIDQFLFFADEQKRYNILIKGEENQMIMLTDLTPEERTKVLNSMSVIIGYGLKIVNGKPKFFLSGKEIKIFLEVL